MTKINYILRRKGVGEKIGAMEELSETGIKVIRSDKELPENPGYVFRWGTTATIPRTLDTVEVNHSSAIHKVYDKRMFRKELADNGLSMKTWIDFGEILDGADGDIFSHAEKAILRPKNHIRSLDLNVCSTLRELYDASRKYEEYYISEYIKKDNEYRIFVIGGRVVAVVKKIPVDKDAVSWGCVDEGQFKYVPWDEWPLQATQKAVQAFHLSELDFGAIDLITLQNQSYVLEINTAPELTPYYMKCYMKCFDWITKNGNQKMNFGPGNDWRSQIHPAISNAATGVSI